MRIANVLTLFKFLYNNARLRFAEPKHVRLMTNIRESCLTAMLRLYSTQYLGYRKC
jgi:hypothetical protein